MDILRADRKDLDHAIQEVASARIQSLLEMIGIVVSRYGLVVVLLLIGVLKFTPGEAGAIQPLVEHSPLMSWMYSLFGVQGVSNLIGVIEIATAALMALRPFSPKASFVGSLAAVVTFLLTVSFLFSTPGAAQLKYGFPVLGDAGQFLIKDLVLLGASFWTAAEAHRAAQRFGAWLVFFAKAPIHLKYR
jgi:uncharacterized membrane protein YkgB